MSDVIKSFVDVKRDHSAFTVGFNEYGTKHEQRKLEDH